MRAGRRPRSISRRCADGQKPYQWDDQTGLSRRIIPGQPGGAYTVTGLSHDEGSKVAYSSGVHQRSSAMRSRKIAVLQSMLVPPVHLRRRRGGPAPGRLGEHQGCDRGGGGSGAAPKGLRVSSLHLRFLSPLEPGLQEIFARFRKVCTVEINYSDEPGDPLHHRRESSPRAAQLAVARDDARGRRLLDPGTGRAAPSRAPSCRRYPRANAAGRCSMTAACALMPVLHLDGHETRLRDERLRRRARALVPRLR